MQTVTEVILISLELFIIIAIIVLCAIVFSSKETRVNIVYDDEDEDEFDEFYEEFMLIDMLDEEEEEYDDEQ